ncbi:MAG TPA: PHB depolymerase family esterase [Steroidobacteraceae bacterium]|nr:PHB depolymerase family esterase [Steroidobacteraceae bacterium]
MDIPTRRVGFVLLCLLGLAWMARLASADEPHTEDCQRSSVLKSIVVDGVARTYLLYVPCNFRPQKSALIVGLHGRTATAALFETQSQLDKTANREGFAVAYLDGLVDSTGGTNWNYFYDPFFTNPPDDVGFVRAVIDSLQAAIQPNSKRIYVTGTSAGGFMAQTVGIQLADRVAAIAAVEGNAYVITAISPQSIPNPVAPVSVLMLKGDLDPFNYYCGATFTQFAAFVSSADQDFEYWTAPAANRCSRVNTQAPMCKSVGVVGPDGTVLGRTTDVVKKSATHCKDDTEVKVYRLIGGTDAWNQNPMNVPGQIPFNPDLNRHTGVTTNDILWRFFVEHPKAHEVRSAGSRPRIAPGHAEDE